ncbi:hypothetical protein ASPZODRAFT_12071 [Penicilliopsis zonata CBS 506.65]|uniref:Uncharacterized protein n=1 Tax=Penicilliopsis zonata CBS 506.65 TaxID=1073090 RepID=A0A1L9SVZ9_9EURO|nr:hypothetical protein ASPZODRAFT_12071 [Penicilliopsis zonata CBS 506.65]OJJ51233.1 hypothetical protein ASPZODRAFT_12071 [Penicilliopsis zonata CBS 506.65]
MLSFLRRSSCDGSANECEKPTSQMLTMGVPLIISSTLVVTAFAVLTYLYYKRRNRDDREDREERAQGIGYYARDEDVEDLEPTYRQPGNKAANRHDDFYPASSRRGSDASFLDVKDPNGPYHLSDLSESTSTVYQQQGQRPSQQQQPQSQQPQQQQETPGNQPPQNPSGEGWRDLVNENKAVQPHS